MTARKKTAAATPSNPEPERLLTVKEVGAQLGISHDSVARLLKSGQLKAIDVRTTGPKPRLRISSSEIARFLKAREIPTAARAGIR